MKEFIKLLENVSIDFYKENPQLDNSIEDLNEKCLNIFNCNFNQLELKEFKNNILLLNSIIYLKEKINNYFI